VLVLNRDAAPADPWQSASNAAVCGLPPPCSGFLFAGWALTSEIIESRAGCRQFYVDVKHPPVFGLYDVEAFRLNGTALRKCIDPARWRKAWFPPIQSSASAP